MDEIADARKIYERFLLSRDQVFVIDGVSGREYTYGDIEKWSRKTAAWLKAQGVQRGDRLALVLPNCPEYLFFHFAAVFLGVVLVPVNYKWSVGEMLPVFLNARPSFTIAAEGYRRAVQDALTARTTLITVNVAQGQNLAAVPSFFSLIEQIEPLDRASFVTPQGNDVLLISYTSGTTGVPKGVIILYRNIIQNGLLFNREMGIDAQNRFYCSLPFVYMGGWYNLMTIPFLAGATIVLMSDNGPMFFVHFWNDVIRYNANSLWLVPTIMAMLLRVNQEQEVRQYCRRHIRLAIVGTAPLLSGLKRAFERTFGVTLYENYGLSETCFLSLNSPLYKYNKGVGKIFPFCQIEIMDEAGRPCPQGMEGEVVAQTPFCAPGYEGHTTDNLFDGKVVHTGDIGFLDQDCYLFITGRKKDIIIKGGVNISPMEIENIISTHPAVEEVAVVGVPDVVGGEEVAAVVATRKTITPDEIRILCSSRLAHYKVPKYIIANLTLPRSVTGKIQKYNLREKVIEYITRNKA